MKSFMAFVVLLMLLLSSAHAQWGKNLVQLKDRPLAADLNFNAGRLNCLYKDGAVTYELLSTGSARGTVVKPPLAKEKEYLPFAVASDGDSDQFLMLSKLGAHFWSRNATMPKPLVVDGKKGYLEPFSGRMLVTEGGNWAFFWFRSSDRKDIMLNQNHYEHGYLINFDRSHTFLMHDRAIEQAVINQKGTVLFIAGGGKLAKWNLQERPARKERTWDLGQHAGLPTRVISMASSAEGELAVLADNGKIFRLSGADQKELGEVPVDTTEFYAVAIDPDGKQIAVAYNRRPEVERSVEQSDDQKRNRSELVLLPGMKDLTYHTAKISGIGWLEDGSLISTDEDGQTNIKQPDKDETLFSDDEGQSFGLIMGADAQAFCLLQTYHETNVQRGRGLKYVAVVWRPRTLIARTIRR